MLTAIAGLRPYRVQADVPAGAARRSCTMNPMLPANGPTPPMTATTTASQSGITRRRTAIDARAATSRSSRCRGPSRRRLRVRRGPGPSQTVSSAGRRPSARTSRYLSRLKVITRAASRRRRSTGSRLVRPGVELGRPPGVGVVLGVALHLGARRAATPGRRTSPCRSAATRAPRPRTRSGSTDHSSSSSRVERLDRVLADLDGAAGAERPAARPRTRARRAAAGQPAPVGVAHDAQHRQRARPRRRRAAAPSAPAAASAAGRRRRPRTRTAARPGRRGRASRGPAARRSRRRRRRSAPGRGSNGPRAIARPPGRAPRAHARGCRSGRSP